MTPEERFERIEETLEYVATMQRSHDDQIGRLVEQGNKNERLIAVLTERTIQTMEAINSLTRIVAAHEERLDNLENPRQ